MHRTGINRPVITGRHTIIFAGVRALLLMPAFAVAARVLARCLASLALQHEVHAAFGAFAWVVLLNFRMHRTGINAHAVLPLPNMY